MRCSILLSVFLFGVSNGTGLADNGNLHLTRRLQPKVPPFQRRDLGRIVNRAEWRYPGLLFSVGYGAGLADNGDLHLTRRLQPKVPPFQRRGLGRIVNRAEWRIRVYYLA